MKTPLLMIAALGLLATGCGNKPAFNDLPACDFDEYEEANARKQGPRRINKVKGSISDIALNSVVYTDPQLQRQVIVQSVKARRTEASTVEVTARLQNCTTERLAIAARTSFLDGDQASVEPVTIWKTVYADPYSTGVYSAKSIGQGSVEFFLIEIRTAER